mgnify:CR=1 FL=1
MISVDSTVFIHIINMIALMLILNKVLYKPIIEIMEKRQDSLDTLSDNVEKYERNAKDRQAELDRKMREASTRAKAALDAARNEAARAAAAKLAAGKAQSDADAARAQSAETESKIDRMFKKAMYK